MLAYALLAYATLSAIVVSVELVRATKRPSAMVLVIAYLLWPAWLVAKLSR